MPDTLAIVLAGGNVHSFGILTRHRSKGALPFGGFYRIIDFVLSNLSHSEITHVGLVIQYLPASLIEHVGVGESWDLHGIGRELKIMPPYIGQGSIDWFNGTADAIYQNLNFVEDFMPDDVIIMSGEHVYQMDYRPALEFHRERDADVTIISKQIPRALCSRRFGYLKINDDHEVTEYVEKPDSPPSRTISTGIHIFKRKILFDWLETNARSGRGHNLANDILPFMVGSARIFAFPFEGRWEYLPDVEAYYHVHQHLLRPDAEINMVEWDVMTNLLDRSLAQRVSARVGSNAEVEQSMISPGCEIEGVVRGSVLSPGVIIEKGAIVHDSILMHDTVVRSGAKLNRVVCDKDVVFGKDSRVGLTKGWTAARNPETPPPLSPLTVVGKRAEIEVGAEVSAGKEISQVFPRSDRTTGPYDHGAAL